MKKTFLLTRLVLPLTVAAAGSMVLSLLLKDAWRSLLVNLAAAFLGSIVTVLYVDVIVRREERRQWLLVMEHVGRQLTAFANASISTVRLAIRVRFPRVDNELEFVSDPRKMRAGMIQIANEILTPQLPKMREMDQEDWRKFAAILSSSLMNADRLLSLFGRNLDPTITRLVLDIQEKSQELVGHYLVYPDMLGIRPEELPLRKDGSSIEPYMHAVYTMVISESEALLKLCARLLQEVDSHFSSAA